MLNAVIQKNLLLWDNVFQDMKNMSVDALNQSRHFLPIHYTFRNSFPYIDNMILYCNQYLDGQIDVPDCKDTDLFSLAENYRQKIDEIHRVILQQQMSEEIRTDFYNDEAIESMGALLYKINRLPSQQGYIQRYFLESTLFAASSVQSLRRLDAQAGLAKNISYSELPEQFMGILARQGIDMNEENEESVFELLCQTCGEVLASRQPAVPVELNKKLSQVFCDSFAVDQDVLQSEFQDQSEILCRFIKDTRTGMRQPQAAIRNILMFSQNIEHIPHKDAERMIYITRIPGHVTLSANQISSQRYLPEYVRPFENNKDFQQIKEQMPYWESYEKASQDYDKKSINAYGGMMAVSWLRYLYQDLNYYEELLDKISEQKSDEEDDPKLYRANTKESETEVLDFVRELLVASKYGAKYVDFKVNKSGVEENTIDKMQQKDTLDMRDISILGEIIHHIGENLDDGINVLQVVEIPDYASAVEAIEKMPHGADRKDALTCVSGALNVVFEDMYEMMEASLFDVDCFIGQKQPLADEMLVDFIKETKDAYPDLNDESVESLAQKIHSGAVAAYLIPMYQKVQTNGTQKDAALAFIDDYENMQPETQKFLQGLTQYYVQKVIANHPIWQPQEYSPEFKEALESYDDAQVSLRYLVDLQDSVDKALTEETSLLAKYHKYQKQKAVFELPQNFDLMLAAHFANLSKRR